MTADTAKPTAGTLKETMAQVLGTDVSRLGDEVVLMDLVSSSFLLIEMIIEVQEEFGTRFNQEDMQDVKTVGDLVELFVTKTSAAG